MLEELKNIKSGKKEVKEFALVIAIALIVFAIIAFFKRGVLRFDYLIAAVVFFVLRLVEIGITILRPMQKIWMCIAHVMGFIMSRIILGFVFYFVLTPIGLLGRMFGKEFLDQKINKSKQTYWLDRDINIKTDCESQF